MEHSCGSQRHLGGCNAVVRLRFEDGSKTVQCPSVRNTTIWLIVRGWVCSSIVGPLMLGPRYAHMLVLEATKGASKNRQGLKSKSQNQSPISEQER